MRKDSGNIIYTRAIFQGSCNTTYRGHPHPAEETLYQSQDVKLLSSADIFEDVALSDVPSTSSTYLPVHIALLLLLSPHFPEWL